MSLMARRRARLLNRLVNLEESQLVLRLHQNPLQQERIQAQLKELPPQPRLHLSDLL